MTAIPKPSRRGGKRAGAGRPKLPEGDARINISATVHPSTHQKLVHIAFMLGDRKGSMASWGEVLDYLATDIRPDE